MATSKKKKSFNNLTIGIILGIIIPLISVYFFYLAKNLAQDFGSYIEYLIKYKLVTKILSVAAISNLAVFYIFLQTNRYQSSRGIIIATFLYAIITILYLFIF